MWCKGRVTSFSRRLALHHCIAPGVQARYPASGGDAARSDGRRDRRSPAPFSFPHRDWAAELWRREFQNKNGANSKTTEYAANIQKADLEEALPGPLSYVLSSIPSRCAAALAIVMCASIPTASKPSSAAAASVVPLPANGSRILPPGTHICTT